MRRGKTPERNVFAPAASATQQVLHIRSIAVPSPSRLSLSPWPRKSTDMTVKFGPAADVVVLPTPGASGRAVQQHDRMTRPVTLAISSSSFAVTTSSC